MVKGYQIQIEFAATPCQVRKLHSLQYSMEQLNSINKGVRDLLQKRGGVSAARGAEWNRILFKPLSGPEEGQCGEAHNQHEGIQWVCAPVHFKVEGIHTFRELINPVDWLTKVDLKDTNFTYYPYPPHTEQIPQIHGERECLPVQLFPIWSVTSYQDCKDSSSTPTGVGCLSDLLHGWYTHRGGEQGEGRRVHRSSCIPAVMPEFLCKLKEICADVSADNGLPWFNSRHCAVMQLIPHLHWHGTAYFVDVNGCHAVPCRARWHALRKCAENAGHGMAWHWLFSQCKRKRAEVGCAGVKKLASGRLVVCVFHSIGSCKGIQTR